MFSGITYRRYAASARFEGVSYIHDRRASSSAVSAINRRSGERVVRSRILFDKHAC